MNFDAILPEFEERLRRFFSKRGFTGEESRELAQITLTKAWQHRGGFAGKDERTLAAWIFRIARNTSSNYLRDKEKDRGKLIYDAEDGDAEDLIYPPERASQLEGLIEEEARRHLEQAVDALPEQMRRCRVLRIYQNRSYKEIARLMKVDINTVKSHISQGKQKVTSRMERVFNQSGVK
jgi:RNA polymerase sigma-70 factor (ECF subfamily)